MLWDVMQSRIWRLNTLFFPYSTYPHHAPYLHVVYLFLSHTNFHSNYISQNMLCCCCFIAKLCPILWNPMDYSQPGSMVHGISQAVILEWVAIFFSRANYALGDVKNYNLSHLSCCVSLLPFRTLLSTTQVFRQVGEGRLWKQFKMAKNELSPSCVIHPRYSLYTVWVFS